MASAEAGKRHPSAQRRVAVAAFGGVALIVVVSAYNVRQRISEALIHAWLLQHGAASTLHVNSISLTGFSANVCLGSPQDPDLTVDRVEVGYALRGPWTGSPFSVETRVVRAVRPRLKLRLLGSTLNFGALQTLIEDLSKGPPSKGPPPDLFIEDGAVRLLTAGGELNLRGDAVLKAGSLATLKARLAPFQLSTGRGQLSGQGGDVSLDRRDQGLDAAIGFRRVEGRSGADDLKLSGLTVKGRLPDLPQAGRLAGFMDLVLAVQGASATVMGSHAKGGDLTARVRGSVDATADRQALSGTMNLSSQLAALALSNVSTRQTSASVQLSRLTIEHKGAALSLSAEGIGGLDAAVAGAGVEGTVHSGPIRLHGINLAGGSRPLKLSGALEGGVSGQGGMTQAAAAHLLRSIPGLAGDPGYRDAAERGLRRFRVSAPRWRADLDAGVVRLALASPAHLDTESGAHVSLATSGPGMVIGRNRAAGSATIAISGGSLPTLKVQVADGAISGSTVKADVAAKGALDLPSILGGRFDIKGRLSGDKSRYRFDLTADAALGAERIALDPNAIKGFSAVLRQKGGPLLQGGPKGWSAGGRLQNVQGDMPGVDVWVRGADATLSARGRKALDGVDLAIEQSQLIDDAKAVRFRPLGVSGRVTLSDGVWSGDLKATAHTGQLIGHVRLRHEVATASGRADIDAAAMRFKTGALQPADLSPLATFAKDANGPASFSGWFAWTPGTAMKSGGALTAEGLTFTSPVGPVLGIDAHIRFSSLSPLVSAPDQMVTVELVRAVTPLSGLSTQFDFNDKAVSIDAAEGGVARGHIRLEPMTVPLTPNAGFKGVLVLDHVNVGDIIAASTLADAVKMDAVVDGRIPFEYGPSGLTIRQGRLAATAPGRISISRKGIVRPNAPGRDLPSQRPIIGQQRANSPGKAGAGDGGSGPKIDMQRALDRQGAFGLTVPAAALIVLSDPPGFVGDCSARVT